MIKTSKTSGTHGSPAGLRHTDTRTRTRTHTHGQGLSANPASVKTSPDHTYVACDRPVPRKTGGTPRPLLPQPAPLTQESLRVAALSGRRGAVCHPQAPSRMARFVQRLTCSATCGQSVGPQRASRGAVIHDRIGHPREQEPGKGGLLGGRLPLRGCRRQRREGTGPEAAALGPGTRTTFCFLPSFP